MCARDVTFADGSCRRLDTMFILHSFCYEHTTQDFLNVNFYVAAAGDIGKHNDPFFFCCIIAQHSTKIQGQSKTSTPD
jgi:hypothetical protein